MKAFSHDFCLIDINNFHNSSKIRTEEIENTFFNALYEIEDILSSPDVLIDNIQRDINRNQLYFNSSFVYTDISVLYSMIETTANIINDCKKAGFISLMTNKRDLFHMFCNRYINFKSDLLCPSLSLISVNISSVYFESDFYEMLINYSKTLSKENIFTDINGSEFPDLYKLAGVNSYYEYEAVIYHLNKKTCQHIYDDIINNAPNINMNTSEIRLFLYMLEKGRNSTAKILYIFSDF